MLEAKTKLTDATVGTLLFMFHMCLPALVVTPQAGELSASVKIVFKTLQ